MVQLISFALVGSVPFPPVFIYGVGKTGKREFPEYPESGKNGKMGKPGRIIPFLEQRLSG
jgi:hypothetical protein